MASSSGLGTVRNVLLDAFRERERVVTAFSGGVDSALLARLGHDALGEDHLAVIVDSESFPSAELRDAVVAAKAMGVGFEVVEHSELADPAYRANPVDRCYHCRAGMSERLLALASERGFRAVAIGNNVTDLGDHRPGLNAIAEAGLWQPYLEQDVDKATIRALAQDLDVPVHDKPSMACMSSRIPHGEPVTLGKLQRIEAAESYLRGELGFEQVRVRTLEAGAKARVEVFPREVPRLREVWDDVVTRLRSVGYRRVVLDEEGYRMGKLNELIPSTQEQG